MRANRIPRMHGSSARANCRTPATGWPLADWADRSPRVRWPLIVLALALLWGLAGSGDLDLYAPATECDEACSQALAAQEATT